MAHKIYYKNNLLILRRKPKNKDKLKPLYAKIRYLLDKFNSHFKVSPKFRRPKLVVRSTERGGKKYIMKHHTVSELVPHPQQPL